MHFYYIIVLFVPNKKYYSFFFYKTEPIYVEMTFKGDLMSSTLAPIDERYKPISDHF